MKHYKRLSVLVLGIVFALLSCGKEEVPNPLTGTEWTHSRAGNITFDNSRSWHHFSETQAIYFMSNALV